jgi:hypothetical protein
MFPTTISGLPELLFKEGFQEYESFCTKISSFANSVSSYNDTEAVNMISFDDDDVHVANDPSDDDINTFFMLMSLSSSKTDKESLVK